MNIRKLGDNADFWAGIMFLFFGIAAVYLSRNYPMGTAMRMGPGYFPTYLGYLMMIFGLIIAGKAALRGGESMGTWVVRPIVVLGGGVIAFGVLMERIGFVLALAVLIVISALAGREYKWLEVLILVIVLVAGAVGVFIYGIGLPYQLFWN